MIYLIKAKDKCKIGFSKHPEKRLKQLQTGNPEVLEIAGVIKGTISDEKQLHNKFKKYKIDREWFRYNKEIKNLFDTVECTTSSIFMDFLTFHGTLAEIKVFAYLLENYGTGVFISINKTIKEEICEATGLSNINTIGNVLTNLQTKKMPMLFKKGRGTFILNPRYAFKGSSKTRDKELMAIIKLGCTNC